MKINIYSNLFSIWSLRSSIFMLIMHNFSQEQIKKLNDFLLNIVRENLEFPQKRALPETKAF